MPNWAYLLIPFAIPVLMVLLSMTLAYWTVRRLCILLAFCIYGREVPEWSWETIEWIGDISGQYEKDKR